MKMRDLERRTGVNRETIRVYLREKLLPEPQRPKPNVAEYDEAHVRGILAIRELQHERNLSIPQIKRAMAGNLDAMPADPSAFPHLDTLLAARLGVDDALIPLSGLLSRNPNATPDAKALAAIGAIRLRRRNGAVHLSPTDAQIVGLWGDMRAAGFTEEQGFTPAITRFYVEAAEALAKEEVTRFLDTLGNRLDARHTAKLAQSAIDIMLPFFGLLRMKAVLEAFAQRSQAQAPAKKAESQGAS
ncbi:MerR family transcriptional regulator [Parvibaculum sp.]|uniref:MerR family transcriptional regulator n=1 Tax=Parvibaculum sp. TaxID=2024848 RepID=UPI00320C8F63